MDLTGLNFKEIGITGALVALITYVVRSVLNQTWVAGSFFVKLEAAFVKEQSMRERAVDTNEELTRTHATSVETIEVLTRANAGLVEENRRLVALVSGGPSRVTS